VLRSALDDELMNGLLKASIEHGGLQQSLISAEFKTVNCGLYRQLLQIRRTAPLTETVVQRLKEVSTAEWSQGFSEPDELFPLVADLVKWEVPLGFGHHLQDALLDIAEKTIRDKIPDHIKPETCHNLVLALNIEQQAVFKRNLMDKLIQARTSVARLLMLFSTELSDCDVLLGKADDLVRVGLRGILERGNVEEYEWVAKILQACTTLLERCPGEIKHDFIARVAEADETKLSKESAALLAQIRRLCGAS
jgi:hypothetical protein